MNPANTTRMSSLSRVVVVVVRVALGMRTRLERERRCEILERMQRWRRSLCFVENLERERRATIEYSYFFLIFDFKIFN